MITNRVIPPTSNNETVAPIVKFRNRKFTDCCWGILYGLSYIAFLFIGFYICSQAQPRFSINSNGIRTIHEYHEEDALKCCEGGSSGQVCYVLLKEEYYGGNRRLQAGNSKFNGDDGMFDAFLQAPELIIGLLGITLLFAIVWVLLLRFFSKPVVILTEITKVVILITVGIQQGETELIVLFLLGAVGIIVYDYWARKQILFAADMMKYSTIAMKANPSILIGSLFVNVLFVLNTLCFIIFFAKSFEVAQVVKSESCSNSYNGDGFIERNCEDICEFKYPNRLFGISLYLSISYLWTIFFLRQMRRFIITTIVGSWHFHPNDQAGLFVSIMNVGKSFGTLSVSSLISTIAGKINRLMSGDDWWKYWFNPLCCVTAPVNLLLLCLVGHCFGSGIYMLTNFALILHVFTGKSFMDSGKSVSQIMSRHFKGGFVTETTSKSLLYMASYIFSILIALLAWKWVDDKFECNSLPGDEDASTYSTAYVIGILFTLWYPVLGLYIIILANRLLQEWERDNFMWTVYEDRTVHTNHNWIPPLIGAFVGCIAMMFFTFLADVFLDIINTIFLCFAIDKDNYVDTSNDEFESLLRQMPEYIDASDVEIMEQPIPVASAVFSDEMPSPSAPPADKCMGSARC